MDPFLIFGLAALGGLILNFSPCLLPVLSIKILGFIRHGKHTLAGRLLHGACYAGGLILSFLALGAIMAFIKVAGGEAIFGMHLLNSALFNGLLGAFIGLMGGKLVLQHTRIWEGIKSLLKRFKSSPKAIKPSAWSDFKGKMAEWGDKIKKKAPLIGSFTQGSLTCLMGSACCGPFLASSMGVALQASPWVIMGAFGAAGIGMALPYILLALIPAGQRFLPKSGKWMVWVERFCGGALLLTSAWFLWLAF